MSENIDSGRYLEPNEVARRFGAKPGFQLIDFTQVALPIFVVPIDAIVVASKPLPLVDEFLLRSITEGVDTLEDIAGFLGLEASFVKKRLGELIGQDLLGYAPSQDGKARATLTAKGMEALKKVMVVQPKRESFTVAIDGITRHPLAVRPTRLLAVRDVRAFGLLEVRAFPEDKAPEFSEVSQMDLTSAVANGTKKEKSIQRVMSLVHMGRRLRRFREATMLIFRAERGRQIHVEFFIDGRPSTALSEAFARYDGVKALHIPEQADASVARTETEINGVMPTLIGSEESQQAAANRPKLQACINQVGLLEARIEEKEILVEEARSRDEVEALRSEIARLQGDKAKVESELNSLEMRFVEVHEHRPMFERSLIEAQRRLLIISPWIRDSVLNTTRLDKISKLVQRGVDVFIGYGLGEDDKPGRDKGEEAIKLLNQLSYRYSNLHFHELGYTHAKILLVDDSFAVIGSFNWFSFEGSSRRYFREEMSFRINKKAEIERLFRHYLVRFPNAEGSTQTEELSIDLGAIHEASNAMRVASNPSLRAEQSKGTIMPQSSRQQPSNSRGTQVAPAKPPAPKSADNNIISLQQFADELGQPIDAVLKILKPIFPNLAGGARVNRSSLLQHWKARKENPEKASSPTIPLTKNPAPHKSEVVRETSVQTRPPTASPQIRAAQTPPETKSARATQAPPQAKAAVSSKAGKRPYAFKGRRDEPKPISIRVLANYLGVSLDSIVEDLGWGSLRSADCMIAHSHVVRLCQKHNRPVPET
jgi:PLD-like domain